MKFTKSLLLVVFKIYILLFQLSCSAGKKNTISIPELMTKDSLKLEFISDCLDKDKLKGEKDVVEVILFEQFDDTLSIYVNNKHLKDWAIYTKNNPFTSTGFSGISFKLLLKNKKNLIRFQLVKKRKYVEFCLDKHYSRYTVQLYENVWYIKGTQCYLNFR